MKAMYVLDPALPQYTLPIGGPLAPLQLIGMRQKINLADKPEKDYWPFKGRFG